MMKLLQKDCMLRLTAAQSIKDPWITSNLEKKGIE